MIFNPSSRKGTAKVNHFFENAKFILRNFSKKQIKQFLRAQTIKITPHAGP